MLLLNVVASAGTATLEQLIVARLGTAIDADTDTGLDALHLWHDVNGNGIVDGVDVQLNTATFLSGSATLTAAHTVAWFLPDQLIISVDLRPQAAWGATIGVRLVGPENVVSGGGALVGGVYPATSFLTIITAPPAPDPVVEASGNVGQDTALTITTEGGAISSTVPAGATPLDLTVTLEALDQATLPRRPGAAVGGVHRIQWMPADGSAPAALASPVRVEIDLAALLADGDDPNGLRVMALGEDGIWMAIPATLSADGLSLIIAVSVSVTFTVVQTNAAVVSLVPPNGGSVMTADGSAAVTVPAGASDRPVLVSLTPSTAATPALSGGGRVLGTPVVVHQEDPVTQLPATLTEPLTLALTIPDTSDVPECAAGCSVVPYVIPADGGVPYPLPTRESPDGSQILVSVTVDVTIVLAAAPSAVSGEAAAGEALTLSSLNGEVQVAAEATDAPLAIVVAPAAVGSEVPAGLPAIPATPPRSVVLRENGQEPSGDGRATVISVALNSLAPGTDVNRLQAFGTPTGTGAGAPSHRLPVEVDVEAGVIRIEVRISVTIYIGVEAVTRDVPLEPGWNLLTFRGAWLTYFPEIPGEQSLTRVDDGDAIWVLISAGESMSWTLPDPPLPPQSVTLQPGWNLVSWRGPDIAAVALVAPLQDRLGSAYAWRAAEARLEPFLLAVGPPLEITVHTHDPVGLFVTGSTPVTWTQPGIDAG